MADHLDELRAAVAAIRVTSPTSYTWFGARAYRLAPRWSRTLSAEAAAVHLAAALTGQLYRDYYTRGRAIPADPVAYSRPPASVADERHPSRWVWEPGWTVREVAGDEVGVARGDVTVWVPRSHSAPERGELEPSAGVSVLLPAVSRTISPGFVVVNGTRPPTIAAGATVVRVYWNLRSQARDGFVERVTRDLDAAGVGHSLKVLDVAGDPHRCDTAVLFLAPDALAAAAPVLRSLVAGLVNELRDGTPALTARLARGVAVAESRGTDSFGRTRCRVIAEALVATHAAAPDAAVEQRFRAVLDHLAAAGVRSDAPHLAPGSTVDYVRLLGGTAACPPAPRTGRTPGLLPRSVAGVIARRLCDEALWHGERCNWIGLEHLGTGPATLRALGADLYDGAAGIALFLAHAAGTTGDSRTGRTAIGAAHQAVALATEGAGPDVQIGFYCGAPGVAFAAAQVGVLLGRHDLVVAAQALLRRTSVAAEASETADLMAGHAGRIVALLCLAHLVDDPGLLDAAERSGMRLLDLAVRQTRGGWSWPAPDDNRRQLHLTGFGHGAAGIGHALAELYGATRKATYRQAALHAFDYERTWFSAPVGNWPDLRRTTRRAVAQQAVFGQAWCHGAPGIALSRLRAYELLGDPVLLREAQVALSTTVHAIQRALAAGPADYSLCHGLLGQVDVVIAGRRYAPGCRAATKQLVERVTRGASVHARRHEPWPCGSPAGEETPGLMLGIAGIGYQHLRTARPRDVGSLLLPVPSPPRRRCTTGAP